METKPKERVVISGKGGAGKTSIVASFAALADKVVLADCDVDAADLHLVLDPKIVRRESFSGGNRARVKPGHCTACGKCKELCRFDAIDFDGPGNGRVDKTFRIDPIAGADLVLIVTEPTRSGLRVAGRVRYDRAVTDAQIQKQAVVEYRQNGCTEDIRRVWDSVSRKLRKANEGD